MSVTHQASNALQIIPHFVSCPTLHTPLLPILHRFPQSTTSTMGTQRICSFLRKKGYEATIPLRNSATLNPTSSGLRRFVDVLGPIFLTIRHAYNQNDGEAAQKILENELEKLACPTNSILYIDDYPTEEKLETHNHRRSTKKKALTSALSALEKLEASITGDTRVRKHHFLSAKEVYCKNLALLVPRTSLARHVSARKRVEGGRG